MPLTER